MKVLDLHCSQQHSFEGWFASEDDFQSQLARGLVTCPMCADDAITKKLSAPRLNLTTFKSDLTSNAPEPAQMQATMLNMMRHVVSNTEDVGASFPQEARKMHYGEVAQRNIRGQASPQETEALLDEGISVLPLPMPEALKETLQ